ncbi:unnamed protein product [Bemisia tabaci]|uniref:CUB domain-containing protein n=1 Tax=Bemisia tabaci TaxID=7038 RepID=A0A9P0F4C2_BEMTA|nr:unnamed protein product [Bemisia tabaci]
MVVVTGVQVQPGLLLVLVSLLLSCFECVEKSENYDVTESKNHRTSLYQALLMRAAPSRTKHSTRVGTKTKSTATRYASKKGSGTGSGSSGSSATRTGQSSAAKNKKTVVEMAVCRGTDGVSGICYSAEKCRELAGLNTGKCAVSDGVCCKVERTCHGATKEIISYFVNPNFPSENRESSFCDFRIDINNQNICQIRLDFEEFSMKGPHKNIGVCRKDRFMVTTSLPNGSGISDLCGENKGQHLYVPVDPSVAGFTVSLMVMTSGGSPHLWKIRITQIDCKTQVQLMAPNGCLQYFTDLSGNVQSFNYAGGLYQTNLDYAICIKRSINTCRVEYQQAEGSKFGISSFEGTELSDGIGRAGTVSCDLTTHDYLFIPGGMRDIGDTDVEPVAEDEEEQEEVDGPHEVTNEEKFCGKALSGLAVNEYADKLALDDALSAPENITVPSTVTSYASGPIILRFHTDGISHKDQEIGFSINYQQLGAGCTRKSRSYRGKHKRRK